MNLLHAFGWYFLVLAILNLILVIVGPPKEPVRTSRADKFWTMLQMVLFAAACRTEHAVFLWIALALAVVVAVFAAGRVWASVDSQPSRPARAPRPLR